MNLIALKMLLSDRAKYLSLVVGLSFAMLLIAQQCSIFLGLLIRATGPLQNITQPDLWVADPATWYIMETRPLRDADLFRVRSSPGVEWAEPLLTTIGTVELSDGDFHTVQVIGIDRSTLVGRPPRILAGRLDDLRLPDAVLVEESSLGKLGNPSIGDTFELNDRRARVVGICRAKLGFQSTALIYTTYANAVRFVPGGRKRLTFILAKVSPGADVPTVAASIDARTGLRALTDEQMQSMTVSFILRETGIGINFGVTVLLGFVVGLMVVGATLYQFTTDNSRYLAVYKAMGAGPTMLARLVAIQGLFVGLVSFGVGSGGAAAFSLLSRRPGVELASYFPWQLLIVTAAAMVLCVSLGSLLSIRRVLRLDPALVFN